MKKNLYFTGLAEGYGIYGTSCTLVELTEAVKKFATEKGLDPDIVSIRVDYAMGYYNNPEQYFEFSGSREETDDELFTRKMEEKQTKASAKQKKKEEDAKKLAEEKALYEKLKVKYDTN